MSLNSLLKEQSNRQNDGESCQGHIDIMLVNSWRLSPCQTCKANS